LSEVVRQGAINLNQLQVDHNQQGQRLRQLLDRSVLNPHTTTTTTTEVLHRATELLKKYCRRPIMRLQTSRNHHEQVRTRIDQTHLAQNRREALQAIVDTTAAIPQTWPRQ